MQAISREQQFAEKLHAYMLPRESANGRVKDLVDMALLIRFGGMEPKLVAEAIQITFRRRRTHDVPRSLRQPPHDWEGRFKALAVQCDLADGMGKVFGELERFWVECEFGETRQEPKAASACSCNKPIPMEEVLADFGLTIADWETMAKTPLDEPLPMKRNG